MHSINYIQAGPQDAALLADLRILFLTDLLGAQPANIADRLRATLLDYFKATLPDGKYVAWLAKDGDQVVAVGGMTIIQYPGSFINHEGKRGYIMNMYTIPSHRRMGLCTAILNRLTDTGRQMGIQSFELHATKEGELVYARAGFELHGEPTYRKHYFGDKSMSR